MSISHEDARAVIDAVALALLFVALAGLVIKRLEAAIVLIAAQGVLLSVAAGGAALTESEWTSWAAFLLAVAVKALAIPLMLWFVVRRARHTLDVVPVLSPKLALPAGTGLVLVAYYAAEPFRDDNLGAFLTPNAIPAAVALLLLGLFTMVTRRRAVAQIVGLVTMENGIYLAAIAATHGLPLAVEFGVALDVLTGVALMGLVAFEMSRLYSTTSTDRFQSLRG